MPTQEAEALVNTIMFLVVLLAAYCYFIGRMDGRRAERRKARERMGWTAPRSTDPKDDQ